MSATEGPVPGELPPIPEPGAIKAKARRASGKGFLIGMAVGALLGGVGLLGPLTVRMATGLAALIDHFWLFGLLAIWPLYWFCTAMHELGHVLAGRLVDMRLVMLLMPPLRLTRTTTGFRADIVWRVRGIAGFAIVMPRQGAMSNAQRATMVAGGPLGSALLACGAWWLTGVTADWIAACASVVAFIATIQALLNLLPLPLGGFLTDGAQLLAIARGDRGVASDRHVFDLYGALAGGTRPRDFSMTTLKAAFDTAAGDARREANAHFYAHLRAADAGDENAADLHARELAARYGEFPDGFRQGVARTLAAHEIRYRRDADRARRWLALATGGLPDAADTAVVAAELALLEGRGDDAAQCLDAARRSLRHVTAPGALASAEARIVAVEHALSTQRGSAGTTPAA